MTETSLYDKEAVAKRMFNILIANKEMTVENFQSDLPDNIFKEVLDFLMNDKKLIKIENGQVKLVDTVTVTEEKLVDIEEAQQKSFYKDENGKIYEQIYNKGNGSRFVSWDGEKAEIVSNINIGDITPIEDEGLELGAILLPTEPVCYENLEKLMQDIKQFIHKYLDVSEEFENIAVCYIVLSWIYDRLTTIPYLRALGDLGTGKSRFLDVIGGLCYKACIVSGAITPAPIYRMIKRWGGAIVFDESDFRSSTESQEIIKILNCGFEANKPVIRCLKDNPDTIQFLPTYSPKVFSSRKTFSDKALESRCLTEIMLETTRTDIPAILLPVFYEERQQLINKLLMFRLQNYNKIDPNIIQNIDLGNIEKRLKQATLNFAVLFSNIPELMENFKEFLQKYSESLVDERYSTDEGMIIETIFRLKDRGKELISSQDIAEDMETEYKLKNPMTARSVGRYLKSLGIVTKQKFIDGTNRRVMLWDNKLMELLKMKYIPKVYDSNDSNAINDRNKEQTTL